MLRTTLTVAAEVRVLLIEDNDDDALLILRQLRDHGFRVTADRVDHLDALRGHLENNDYDVIISDYSLPSFTATHALHCVRDAAPDVPFLIVSGRIEEETAVGLVKQGAADFLNKDRLARVGIAVETAIQQRNLLRDKRTAEAQKRTVEERLRHAEKMEAVGHLAGGVAHDFNNLLSIILHYADFVIDDFASGDARPEDVHKIKEAAERGATLTRQLLAFSRKEVSRRQVLDLTTILEEMRMFLEPAIGEDVDLFVRTAKDLWAIEADRTGVEQILINLAVNARDAMPDGGVLTIEACNVEVDEGYAATMPNLEPGRFVRITVGDTGTGIDPGTVGRIFDPFFTTKPSGRGTGLGLATVHGLVTGAGGDIHVYTEQGFGTSIALLLPATDLPQTQEACREEKPLRGGETVLVVEDEDGIRELIDRILTRHGYDVMLAATGSDAVDLAADASRNIDLVVTDVVMPGMLGREVTERLTRLRPNVPIVFMSGYAQAVLDARGRLEPGRVLLQKPFSEVDLLATIRAALDRAGEAVKVVGGPVLVVDDEREFQRSVTRILERAGYECIGAATTAEALDRLAESDVPLVLTDMNMPGDSGLQLLAQIHERFPATAAIMVTAEDSAQLAEMALEVGAYGYMIKPFKPNELAINVSNALRRRRLELGERERRDRLERMVQERTANLWMALQTLERRERDLRVSRQDTIERLSVAAEFRDDETATHIRRMSRYCGALSDWVGLDREQSDMIRTASIMHDVGKIGIPDSILLKPAKLTPDEYAFMQQHAEFGHRILSGGKSDLLQLAATIALTHHEKCDGSGYPRHLQRREIPLAGRIAAVADVFDALTTDRVYRKAFSLPEALRIMNEGRGSHFDAQLLDLFMGHIDEVLRIKEQEEKRS